MDMGIDVGSLVDGMQDELVYFSFVSELKRQDRRQRGSGKGTQGLRKEYRV